MVSTSITHVQAIYTYKQIMMQPMALIPLNVTPVIT